MKKVDDNFLNPMTLDAIRAKVNSCRTGSFHKILMIDGKPIVLSQNSTLYIVETLDVTFNNPKPNEDFGKYYYNRSFNKLERLIDIATSAYEVNKAKEIYDAYKHKNLISKNAVENLSKKIQMIKDGLVIPKSSFQPTKDTKTRDVVCPSIVYNQNGSITLTSYPSFRNVIKSVKGGFEFEEDIIDRRFFVKNKDGVFELDEKEYNSFAKTAIANARAMAKKPSGGPSKCKGPKVNNIIKII